MTGDSRPRQTNRTCQPIAISPWANARQWRNVCHPACPIETGFDNQHVDMAAQSASRAAVATPAMLPGATPFATSASTIPTTPLAFAARGSVQSGFNEVAHRAQRRVAVARPHRNLQIRAPRSLHCDTVSGQALRGLSDILPEVCNYRPVRIWPATSED